MAAKGQTLAEFGNLYPAESKLLAACRDGTEAVIAKSRPKRRTQDNCVRADFIRFLLCGGDERISLHEHGVRLRGAVILGDLLLMNLIIDRSLWIDNCKIIRGDKKIGSIFLKNSTLNGELSLDGTGLNCVNADEVFIKGDCFLRDSFLSTGAVTLRGAEIGGQLSCVKAVLGQAGGCSLSFDNAVIRGSVFFDKLKAKGEVRFLGAKIYGTVSCYRSSFNKEKGGALSFDRATVKGSVSFQAAKFKGSLWFRGAQVGSQLSFGGVDFYSKNADSIVATDSKVDGTVFIRKIIENGVVENCKFNGLLNFEGVVIGGSFIIENSELVSGVRFCYVYVGKEFLFKNLPIPVSLSDFSHMRCNVLNDELNAWGDENKINGFVYTAFADSYDETKTRITRHLPIDIEGRANWIKRQMKDLRDYRPQPWRQLQKTLKAMGHDAEAREIGIAHEEFRYANRIVGQLPPKPTLYDKLSAPLTRGLHWIYGALAGYGYKPLKLVLFSVGIWFIFSWVYWFSALAGYLGPTNPIVFQNPKYGYKEKNCIYERQEFCISVPLDNWYWLPSLPAEYTTFSPMAYSLDLILPLVDLGQEKDWGVLVPTPKKVPVEEILHFSWGHILRLIVWFEILWGWVASLMLVAVISGLVRNTRDDE